MKQNLRGDHLVRLSSFLWGPRGADCSTVPSPSSSPGTATVPGAPGVHSHKANAGFSVTEVAQWHGRRAWIPSHGVSAGRWLSALGWWTWVHTVGTGERNSKVTVRRRGGERWRVYPRATGGRISPSCPVCIPGEQQSKNEPRASSVTSVSGQRTLSLSEGTFSLGLMARTFIRSLPFFHLGHTRSAQGGRGGPGAVLGKKLG